MPAERIICENTRYRLASIDNDAVYFWCKRCCAEHVVTKSQLLKLWGIKEQDTAESNIHPVLAK